MGSSTVTVSESSEAPPSNADSLAASRPELDSHTASEAPTLHGDELAASAKGDRPGVWDWMGTWWTKGTKNGQSFTRPDSNHRRTQCHRRKPGRHHAARPEDASSATSAPQNPNQPSRRKAVRSVFGNLGFSMLNPSVNSLGSQKRCTTSVTDARPRLRAANRHKVGEECALCGFFPVQTAVFAATACFVCPFQICVAIQSTFHHLSLRLPSGARRRWPPWDFISWEDLAAFLAAIPRHVTYREQPKECNDSAVLLTSVCKPLPEDSCLRGLRWGGKRVYPMGFWGKEAIREDRNVEGENEAANELSKRWVRVARAGLKIAKHAGGFAYYLAAKEQRCQWKEERRERKEEERCLGGRRWDEGSMDVDDDEGLAAEESTDDSKEDENDTPEIKALKARRRYLQSLLDSSTQGRTSPSIPRRRPRGPQSHKPARPCSSLRVVPGYTILIVDTNILLSSLAIISSLVESMQWTVVVPLPMIMELDSLSSNASALGDAATVVSKLILGSSA
ncbi:uncharacterized protein B0H18DRAFT_1126964 [Fomitopsis serialis]|uniref:uncharacterized protein n=1 Tax=Fomitopsis serialis TaxID=139415 RepID=UPI002007AD50|nr:uncharacterized protein B0H18DRAFT_1126964 [Neoantrodia serialis]KAH9912648.1 hypothetical protein B0H18DRAFT_1126964 [Neoantrodia serialis]